MNNSPGKSVSYCERAQEGEAAEGQGLGHNGDRKRLHASFVTVGEMDYVKSLLFSLQTARISCHCGVPLKKPPRKSCCEEVNIWTTHRHTHKDTHTERSAYYLSPLLGLFSWECFYFGDYTCVLEIISFHFQEPEPHIDHI